MKVKTRVMSYEKVIELPSEPYRRPKRPNIFFRTLLKLVGLPDLWATCFRLERVGMKRLGKKEPCLILMNHSSFIDLEIATSAFYPRPLNIVATRDAFIGKRWLMRQLGCIPTAKFVYDVGLVKDIFHAVRKNKTSVLLFPEAGYSLDGTATVLPDNFGVFLKKLDVPVVMLRTYGAFARDPLYNNLQRRRTRVSAKMEYLFSPEELQARSAEELLATVKERFTFDSFRWQAENGVRITESFRADMLHRVLYRCPHCDAEGKMEGKGITLQCHACGEAYVLAESGKLKRIGGGGAFEYVSDWFAWQREKVGEVLLSGTYSESVSVKIAMQVDTKALYFVGDGTLTHTPDGFRLSGCDGKLDYTQHSGHMYSVNVDYNFYEIGDMVSFGTTKTLYYCFPKDPAFPVAKLRLATEEMFRQMHGSTQKNPNQKEK